MNEALEKEIGRLKEELARRREEIAAIEKLAGREIDRTFLTDAAGLSERELDPFIDQTLKAVKARVSLKPDPASFASHRRIFGRFVLRLKRKYIKMTRFYMDPILEQQEGFNRHSLDLQQASLSRLGRLKEELREVEARLSQCEEDLIIILNKMKDEEKTRASRD
jgi:hypothetical protein